MSEFGDFHLDWPDRSSNAEATTTTLQEVMQSYDLVHVNQEDGVIVVAERDRGKSLSVQEADYREIGSTGYSVWTNYQREDYNPQLRSAQGWRVFDKMRRNDGQVSMSLRLAKTPIIAARWYMEPASDDPRDRRISEFVWNNLTKWMTMSWPQLLTECLLMLDYGWYAFEKVYDVKEGPGGGQYVIWRKFAPRHPLDLWEWDLDANGGPKGARFYGPDGSADSVYIPVDKLAIFTHQKEAGNLEGISLLRPAYKHWYFKETLYKIDAIQKERHGIGIPIIKLPLGFKAEDRNTADELGRNLRTNEKAHVVLPPMWEIMFAKLEGQPVDCMTSIEHHDKMIARNILGQFMNADRTSDSAEQIDVFMKSARFVADIVRDVFNKYCIPQLVDYNWANVESYPELRVRRLGDTVDHRTISFALRNYVGAALVKPDDELENWIRDEMDLPKPDVDTTREVATPQMPKQPPAVGGMGTGSNTEAGSDQSGG